MQLSDRPVAAPSDRTLRPQADGPTFVNAANRSLAARYAAQALAEPARTAGSTGAASAPTSTEAARASAGSFAASARVPVEPTHPSATPAPQVTGRTAAPATNATGPTELPQEHRDGCCGQPLARYALAVGSLGVAATMIWAATYSHENGNDTGTGFCAVGAIAFTLMGTYFGITGYTKQVQAETRRLEAANNLGAGAV